MALYTKQALENEVAVLNDWLAHHHKLAPLYPQKKQRRDHFVWQLTQMDENKLETIDI